MKTTSLRIKLLSSVALGFAFGLGALAPAARAADLAVVDPLKPAVDVLNGKIEGFGGWADGRFGNKDNFSGGALASLTAPIGDRFGVQVDGLLASQYSNLAYAGAGHFFTRDPDNYLFGAYASAIGFEKSGGLWTYKLGAEAELYFGAFTVSGVFGYEQTRGGPNGVGIRRKGAFFDYVDLSYYATEDLKLSVGHRYTGRNHAAAFGAEYRLPFTGADVSLFGEGRVGENNYKAAWAGLKVYFGGGSKALIQRHRESDPTNWLKDDLFSISARRVRGAGVTPPPEPEPEPCGCGPCGYGEL